MNYGRNPDIELFQNFDFHFHIRDMHFVFAKFSQCQLCMFGKSLIARQYVTTIFTLMLEIDIKKTGSPRHREKWCAYPTLLHCILIRLTCKL